MSSVNSPTVEPERHLHSYRGLCVSALVVMVVLVGFYWLSAHTTRPREGGVYVRSGLDSAQVAVVFSDTTAKSSPMAGRLVLDLLTRNLRVQVDHVGSCGDILDRYVAYNQGLAGDAEDKLEREFRTVRPVLLAGRMMDECFSYTVKYDVPLRNPMRWKNSLLAQVPLRLSLIHPIADFRHFKKDNPGS